MMLIRQKPFDVSWSCGALIYPRTRLVMLHGLDLERTDPPRSAWSTFVKEKAAVEFRNGIGLGITTNRAETKSSPLREAIFLNTAASRQSYQLVTDSGASAR